MPRVADVGTLAKALGSVSPGQPQTHEALTVIPLLGPAQVEPEWVTMAEAGNRARITTVGEAGHGSVYRWRILVIYPWRSWMASSSMARRAASSTRPCSWRP